MWNYEENIKKEYDILFLEFSSCNYNFYKEAIDETNDILKTFKGRVIFLLDDPEIIPKIDREITVWANADMDYNLKKEFGYKFFKKELPIDNFPFHGLMTPKEITPHKIDRAVYYGNSTGGRLKKIIASKLQIPLDVYGKQKNYPFKVNENLPKQHERSDFYKQYLCSICIKDNKHKKYKWLTVGVFCWLA